jgi:hypothetical protein
MKLKSIQKKFRILKDWKISESKSKKFFAQCNINHKKKVGDIFQYGEGNVPKDYLIHEMLHFSIRALWSMDKRKPKEMRLAEENLVQDICKLILEQALAGKEK